MLLEVIAVIGLAAGDRLEDEAIIQADFGSPAQIGRVFLTDHLLEPHGGYSPSARSGVCSGGSASSISFVKIRSLRL